MSTQIIPTRHKARIPHTLSYPIGAKAISEALIGVPQFHQLAVEFRFRKSLYPRTASGRLPAYRVSSLVPKDLVPMNRYGVLQVQFSRPLRFFSASKTMEEKGYYSPSWAITVDAVPRSLRHVIQHKIVAEALPPIRSWLVANSHSDEREGAHGLVFIFDELKNELLWEEHASIEWQTTKAD